jgi:hypothetical protein
MRNRLKSKTFIGGVGGVAIGVGTWITTGGLNPPSPIPPLYWLGISLTFIGLIAVIYALVKPEDETIIIKDNLYKDEWEHYNLLKEAFIKLQYVYGQERLATIDTINRERVLLNDKELQNWIELFLNAEHEMAEFDVRADSALVTRIIDKTSERMRNKYKR